MRLLALLSLSISVSTLPLQGFPADSQNEERLESLPIAPGNLRPNGVLMEPLETTTRDSPIKDDRVPLPPSTAVEKMVDLNGDNQLTLAEVQYAAFVHHGLSANVVKNLFDQVDTDRDGLLTAEEFNNMKPVVLEKAENAALRYMQSVDTDHNKLLSLPEAQAYILREYGIGHRDVERIWRLDNPDIMAEMGPREFSRLRRRIRGMTIRLARQIMKTADSNGDGHISLDEAQAIAFEQEGIQAARRQREDAFYSPKAMSARRRNKNAVAIAEAQVEYYIPQEEDSAKPISTSSSVSAASNCPLDDIGLLKKGRLSKNYERRMRLDEQSQQASWNPALAANEEVAALDGTSRRKKEPKTFLASLRQRIIGEQFRVQAIYDDRLKVGETCLGQRYELELDSCRVVLDLGEAVQSLIVRR